MGRLQSIWGPGTPASGPGYSERSGSDTHGYTRAGTGIPLQAHPDSGSRLRDVVIRHARHAPRSDRTVHRKNTWRCAGWIC